MSLSVLIADDHSVVRTGLRIMLSDSEFVVVGEARDGEEAFQQTVELQPDVVLMDIRMNGTDGLDALGKIRENQLSPKVIIISTYDNPTYVARAVALGADEYVLKNTSRDSLLEAIRGVTAGNELPAGSLLHQVRRSMTMRREGMRDDLPLTSRETQVLRHIALGLSNREIARSLDISVETVKEHVQNVLRKVDVSDRTQAAVWAIKEGLV